VEVEPFLTVRDDKFAVDVDVINALHGASSLKTTGLNRACMQRSLWGADCSDKLSFCA
jgi:hypothetical protein